MIKKGSRVKVLQGRYKDKTGIIEHYHANGSQPTIYVTLPDPKENVLFRDLSLLEEIPEEPIAREVALPVYQNKIETIPTNGLEERIKSLEDIVNNLPATTAVPIKLRCLRCGEIHDPPSDSCTIKTTSPLTVTKEETIAEHPVVAQTSQANIVPFNPRLTACVDCQHKISLSAESCPNCGRYIQTLRSERAEQFGRRWWVITIMQALLATSFILYLLGLILVSFIK